MQGRALMRIVLSLAVAISLAAGFGWTQRLDLLVWVSPKLLELRDPIAPNRPVTWPQGPDVAARPVGERPPNVVVILLDDLGFNDVSFYNGGAADGSLMTPNIDSIAHEGVAFEMGYAANAVCAPSRASIMTGRYSTRFGFEYTPARKTAATIAQWMSDQEAPALPPVIHHDRLDELPDDMFSLGMPAEELTVAELLQQAGYYTAHIGKWHLGNGPGMRPEDQGFDNSLSMAGTAYLPPDSPEVVNARLPTAIDRMVWASMRYAAQFDGGEKFEPNGYLTDYYTDHAVTVIESNRNRPFFLYLAHWGVHNPLQAKREDYEALAHIEDHTLRVYAAMILSIDRSVGRVLRALEETGVADNTLVILTSDNGGADYIGLPDVNHPYRGWKLTHFEGGTHVPFMARWPRVIPAGTRFSAPVQHIDLLPTIASAARIEPPADRPIDGVDFIPYVAGEAQGVPHDVLFWREGYLQSVQHRGWKLITTERPEKDWLFDLAADPTEQRNLALLEPERVAAMKSLLAEHNARQQPPAWPSFIETARLIDKHQLEGYEPGDEYTYWPN